MCNSFFLYRLYYMTTKCPSGMIKRKSYSFKKSNSKTVKVGSKCIKDQGMPGKGPQIIKLPKEDIGILSDYGYSLKLPYDDRIKALKKSIKHIDELKILRHINALRTLFKSNEKYYDKLNKDLYWIQKHYKLHKLNKK
jgi:hypothetical protein